MPMLILNKLLNIFPFVIFHPPLICLFSFCLSLDFIVKLWSFCVCLFLCVCDAFYRFISKTCITFENKKTKIKAYTAYDIPKPNRPIFFSLQAICKNQIKALIEAKLRKHINIDAFN